MRWHRNRSSQPEPDDDPGPDRRDTNRDAAGRAGEAMRYQPPSEAEVLAEMLHRQMDNGGVESLVDQWRSDDKGVDSSAGNGADNGAGNGAADRGVPPMAPAAEWKLPLYRYNPHEGNAWVPPQLRPLAADHPANLTPEQRRDHYAAQRSPATDPGRDVVARTADAVRDAQAALDHLDHAASDQHEDEQTRAAEQARWSADNADQATEADDHGDGHGDDDGVGFEGPGR